MMYLIDTDWVVDHLAGDVTANTLLASLTPQGIAISVITYSEIYVGIMRSPNPKQHERGFRTFLQVARVLPLNKTVAKRNASIRADLLDRGRRVRQRAFDVLIAATALTYNLTLVTRNKPDYSDIPGLALL